MMTGQNSSKLREFGRVHVDDRCHLILLGRRCADEREFGNIRLIRRSRHPLHGWQDDCVLDVEHLSYSAANALASMISGLADEGIDRSIPLPQQDSLLPMRVTLLDRLESDLRDLSPLSRARWIEFVETVVAKCKIDTDELANVAEILAKLEKTDSRYGLIGQLHDMQTDDLDQLHSILDRWTVKTAKVALDEIMTRLRLIEELDVKLRDSSLSEVGDLQPLFERSLWVFGPEFESLEYTSNRGMSEVIATLLGGKKKKGSRYRPDFVMLPEGSAGFYSRDSYDSDGEVSGIASLVIVEIKRVGVKIGLAEKSQPWRYVRELKEKSQISDSTDVVCYVLGSKIDRLESGQDRKGNNVRIIGMSYDTFIKRATKRMLGLRDKLRDAPFLRELGLDPESFLDGA